MKTAAVLFGLAALGGLTLAGLPLAGTAIPPTWMAVAHGLIAATALVALIFAAVHAGLPPIGKAALGVFALAALGGLFLFVNYHLADEPLPVPVVPLHGGLALTAFG